MGTTSDIKVPPVTERVPIWVSKKLYDLITKGPTHDRSGKTLDASAKSTTEVSADLDSGANLTSESSASASTAETPCGPRWLGTVFDGDASREAYLDLSCEGDCGSKSCEAVSMPYADLTVEIECMCVSVD